MKRRFSLLLSVVALIGLNKALSGETPESTPETKKADETKPAPAGSEAAQFKAAQFEARLKRLQVRLERLLGEKGIKPTLAWENESLTISHNTRKFQVHGVYSTGEFAEKATEETGPSADGFIIHATLVASDNPDQADDPQTISEPYWKTRLITVPYFAANKLLVFRVSYHARIDEKFQSEIERIIDLTTMSVCERGELGPLKVCQSDR